MFERRRRALGNRDFVGQQNHIGGQFDQEQAHRKMFERFRLGIDSFRP
jgi:hypothetical protein